MNIERRWAPGFAGATLLWWAHGAHACDAAPDTEVLHAEVASYEARAVWLDAQRMRWPGANASARFKLYRSARAAIVARSGSAVTGADESIALEVSSEPPPERFKYVGAGPTLKLTGIDAGEWLRDQLVVVEEDTRGRVQRAATTQIAGALDDRFRVADDFALGVQGKHGTRFRLWAPTARAVALCLDDGDATPMRFDAANGVWSLARWSHPEGHAYSFLVDVYAPGRGIVRNRVVDPYATHLTADSQRGVVADLGEPRRATDVRNSTDLAIYELHVRDFSIGDASVSEANRGKYLAFTETGSNGMRHLRALAEAGITDVHLLPVFDFATVPESGCDPHGDRAHDCYNWGYDPQTFGVPEGSYASDPSRRIDEFRQMVAALHAVGLRVGMDVVYNHTSDRLPLDRIVPGYYHRLDAAGKIERSTCCANTATENAMMEKLMIDTAQRFVRDYGVDSFRFDLMGHQPRAAMERLRDRVGVPVIGEGWNFGEVANGARFVQAAQLSLAGSGIGTFSDRARDALRGGSALDSGSALTTNKGFLTGARDAHLADLVRVGLAGSIRDFILGNRTLAQVDYNGQPAGYASAPDEVVNYVENHDNLTLFDALAYKLPSNTSRAERARVQILGAAAVAFSQGIAYFHAGQDLLRTKNLDGNSYDSGDAVNAIDWRAEDPETAWTRDAFRDLLRIRASSTLFRMRSAADIEARLHFVDGGDPLVVAARIDGAGYAGADFAEVVYFINADTRSRELTVPELRGAQFALHPDSRMPGSSYDAAAGRFVIPARSAIVYVR